jgi:hypothetical protein
MTHDKGGHHVSRPCSGVMLRVSIMTRTTRVAQQGRVGGAGVHGEAERPGVGGGGSRAVRPAEARQRQDVVGGGHRAPLAALAIEHHLPLDHQRARGMFLVVQTRNCTSSAAELAVLGGADAGSQLDPPARELVGDHAEPRRGGAMEEVRDFCAVP